MAKLNKVSLIGHIGVKPVLNHTTTNQVPVCNLSIAVNDSWKDKITGEKKEKTTWMNVVCYRGLAETVVAHMDKGRQVYVEGRLDIRKFAGKVNYAANGQPIVDAAGNPIMAERYATEIVATDVQFLGKNPNAQAYPAGTAVAPAALPATAPVIAGTPAAVASTFVQAPAGPAVEEVIQPVVVAPPAGV
jgi:single-strand DNA-binding protein